MQDMEANLIKDGNMSGNITSSIADVSGADYGVIDIVWAGTSPVGTITVEGRAGDNAPFATLDFGSSIAISGNTGSHRLILTQIPFTHIRINYNFTSGTGTLNAYIVTKKLGDS